MVEDVIIPTPSFLQLAKYTEVNIQRYTDFLGWVCTIPLERLKFLDEGK